MPAKMQGGTAWFVVRRALRIGKLMDVKGVKLEEIKQIVLEYCTNLGQEAQEERGEVISYLRAMLTRCLREMSGIDLCSKF